MGSDRHLAAKMAAFAAGMKAKAGELERDDIEQLRAQVERDLEIDDPLRKVLVEFAIDCGVYLRDPVKLSEVGADICRHINLLNVPEPPDRDRRDIYG